MKVVLVDVISLDGKLTKGADPDVRIWASVEDGLFLKEAVHSSEAMILGSATYDIVQPKPTANIRRIVLTSNPVRYAQHQVPYQLEFISVPPKQVVADLVADGHTQVLLLGGCRTATSFLKENLVDELWITVEPRIFGSGLPIVRCEPLDVSLQLISSRQLNDKGTMLLIYEVIKSTQG